MYGASVCPRWRFGLLDGPINAGLPVKRSGSLWKDITMFSKRHHYVFSKMSLCFPKDVTMFFQKHHYIFFPIPSGSIAPPTRSAGSCNGLTILAGDTKTGL
jgi:hypothetical protein